MSTAYIQMEFEQHLQCENGCDCGSVCLPIHSIDSIECCVQINKMQVKEKDEVQVYYYLNISTSKICMLSECETYSYWNKRLDSTDLKTSIKTTLDSLRFNKKRNRFQTTPIRDWDFLRSENVKLIYEECCVCQEDTNTKTNCKHPICIPCYDKIKENEDETQCPICRRDCYID